MRKHRKPEGDVFVAGSDSAQQLLGLWHAAVSDPWYLKGRFRELIARATRHPEKEPPAVSRGLLLVQQGLLLTGWPGGWLRH